MSGTLQLQLDSPRYAPDDVVGGSVIVLIGQPSRSLEVFLQYCDETEDYLSTTVSIGSGALHAGDLQAGQRFPFALRLPRDALPAYRSPHGSLYWRVALKSDRPGLDVHESLPIDVVPPDARGVIAPVTPASRETTAPQVAAAGEAPANAESFGTAAPANWYADPSGRARLRWWDGTAWTEHTAR